MIFSWRRRKKKKKKKKKKKNERRWKKEEDEEEEEEEEDETDISEISLSPEFGLSSNRWSPWFPSVQS